MTPPGRFDTSGGPSRSGRRASALGVAAACAIGASLLAPPGARAAGLAFVTAPALPALPAVTLDGAARTANAKMNTFSVNDSTLSGSGWSVTVNGQSGTSLSPVFKQYCPNATCGTDTQGYVTGGQTLPANSLTLNSSGVVFGGGTGARPTMQCSTPCNVDSATAVKIASDATGVTSGTWTTGAFSSTSLTLTAATTVHALPASEVYRVNVVWTLASGP